MAMMGAGTGPRGSWMTVAQVTTAVHWLRQHRGFVGPRIRRAVPSTRWARIGCHPGWRVPRGDVAMDPLDDGGWVTRT